MVKGSFYTIDEVRDALIIDSEGLIYGRVLDVVVEGGLVYLRAYIELNVEDKYVDVDKLVSLLRGKGLRVTGREPLEELVLLARENGITIPYKVVEKPFRLVKGRITLQEVEFIDVKRLSGELVKIVLLKSPREARFRGAMVQHGIPVVEEEKFKGKLVISLERGIIGYASRLVVGGDEPGIRVLKGKGVAGYVNWIKFISTLRKKGYVELAEKLSEVVDPYKESRIPLERLRKVKTFLEEAGEEVNKLLEECISREEVQIPFEDIAWKDILKMREVILVE